MRFAGLAVSVAEREALDTLEAILYTSLPIAAHATDTHGATELCSRFDCPLSA